MKTHFWHSPEPIEDIIPRPPVKSWRNDPRYTGVKWINQLADDDDDDDDDDVKPDLSSSVENKIATTMIKLERNPERTDTNGHRIDIESTQTASLRRRRRRRRKDMPAEKRTKVAHHQAWHFKSEPTIPCTDLFYDSSTSTHV